MTRTKGAKDLQPRNKRGITRSDKGKIRNLYNGKKVKIHGDYLKYFHENYGINKEFTEEIKRKARIQSKIRNQKYGKEIRNKRWKQIKSNPEFLLRYRIRKQFQFAFRVYKKTGRVVKTGKYGIEFKPIFNYLKPFPEDLSKYNIDHIRPLASFKFLDKDGTTNIEEVKKAFAPENHQWLTMKENQTKNASWIRE